MPRHICCLTLSPLFAVLSLANAMAADEAPSAALKRWAILATEDVRQAGFAELVFERAAKESDLELVERDQLETILKEASLATLSQTRGVGLRVQMGRQLRADALLVLSLVPAPRGTSGDSSLQVLIADCRSGARLHLDFLRWQPKQPDESVAACVQAIRDAQQRFDAGLIRLIGVPPFVAKGLATQHDHLQTTLATLLSRSLLAVPGLAVVEMDEAIAIEREHRLPGQPLDARLSPLLIEGEFEVTNRDSKEEPRFRFGVRWLDGQRVRFEEQHPSLSLAQVTQLVERDLVRHWLAHEAELADGLNSERQRTRETTELPEQRRVELLTRQAERFARAGLFSTAASLGEAALLVAPEDHAVRVVLVQHYIQWQNIEADLKWTLADKPRQLKQQQLRLDRARLHLETVLRNRWLNPDGGSRLMNEFLQNRWNNRWAHPAGYRPDPRPWWEMYWELLSLGVRLDAETPDRHGPGDPGFPPGHPQRRQRQWNKFGQWTFSLLIERAIANPLRQQTPSDEPRVLDLVERYIREVAPSDEPLWEIVLWLIRPLSLNALVVNGHLLAADVDRFLDRIAAIETPAATRYATLGRIAVAACNKDTQRLTEWKAELARLRDEPWAKQSPASLKLLEADLASLDSTIVRKRHVLPRNPSPPLDARPGLAFRPLSEMSADWLGWTKGGADWDLLWNSRSVAVMHRAGETEPIFLAAKNESLIVDVAWDGEHVWIATQQSGVRAILPNGSVVCHINVETGLPKWTQAQPPLDWPYAMGVPNLRMVHLQSVRPGQCVVTGSTAEPRQQWVALLTLHEGEARMAGRCRCDVVHVGTAEASQKLDVPDPLEARFIPTWFLTLAEPRTDSRFLLIGRRGLETRSQRPLVIHCDQRTASLGPIGVQGNQNDQFATQAASGHIAIVDSERIEVWQPPRDGNPLAWTLTVRADQAERSLTVPKHVQAPLPFGDELLIPGPRWHRLSKAGTLTPLGESPLPWHSRFSHLGMSAHFGLVAWNVHDRAYQIQVLPTVERAPDLAARFPYVPREQLARHAAAVDALQARGASIDAVWGKAAHKLPLLAGVGNNSSAITRRWHTFVFIGPDWTGAPDDWHRLADLHDLSGVYAVQAKLTNADLRELGQQRNLEALMLVETQATDEGIEHLRGLDQLKFLRLEGPLGGHEFSDESLKHLASLKSLTDLVIYGPGFTDDGLRHWAELRHLKSLWLGDTAISRDGQARLRGQLPQDTRVFDQLTPRPGSQ